MGINMKTAEIVLLSICSSLSLASANIVGILNVHTAPGGHRTTGRDSGQPVAVQVDFSKTQDGTYDITVWSGERQFEKVTRVDVQAGKGNSGGRELSNRTDYGLLSRYRLETKRTNKFSSVRPSGIR
jgi:hypothetical protein